MTSVTTIADVVEEHLERALVPSNLGWFEQLSFTDLEALRDAVTSHTESDYVRLPVFEASEFCCALHPQSPMSRALGGSGWGIRGTPPPGSDEMLGGLMSALMYLPRIAIHDGLEYYLDFFMGSRLIRKSDQASEKFRRIVLNLLSFYAHSRELIRNRNLIVVPRRLWEPMRGMISVLPPVEQKQNEARLVEDLKQHPALQRHRDRLFPQSELAEELNWIVGHEYERIRHLRAIYTTFGYTPVVEGKDQELVFDALLRIGADIKKPRVLEKPMQQRVVLPWLATLPVNEFIAVRNTDVFVTFRDCIEAIAKDTVEYADRPIILKERIREQTLQSKRRLEEEIKKSGVLSKFKSGLREVALGAVGGSLFGHALEGAATVALAKGVELFGAWINPSEIDRRRTLMLFTKFLESQEDREVN